MASHLTRAVRPAGALALAAALAACGESSSSLITGGAESDRTPPAVTVAAAAGAASDSAVAVQVSARDNLGLRRVRVVATQRLPIGRDTTIVGLDTAFSSAVTSFVQTISFKVPAGTPAGTQVTVSGEATDGAGNAAPDASVRVATGNLEPPRVRLTAPQPGSLFVIGKSGIISLAASARLKVRGVGYVATGPGFAAADSVFYREPLRDSVSVIDTVTVPGTAQTGVLTVTPFVIDSLGQRATGVPVQFAVQPITAVNSVPVVSSGVTRRVETQDTVRVAASDPTGIRVLGYEIVDTVQRRVIVADSTILSGQLTVAETTFTFRVPLANLPSPVYVRAFATNMAARRSYTKLPSGVDRVDSVLVVAGTTRALPSGGLLADGVYINRYDRLYLTNIDRNQVEVFSLARQAFERPVVVGSRPWGIVPWPRNRVGTPGDTLLVANSGGTNISYVQLGGDGLGLEVYRYPLPNIIAYSVTSELSATTGEIIQTRKVYDFSDRPQYLAATCEVGSTNGTTCGDVKLVYSTTPTPGQTFQFPNKGTVRWESLTSCTSHFFFEQAMGTAVRRADSLEVERYAAHPSYRLPVTCEQPADRVTLVPFMQTITAADGSTRTFSVEVDPDKLAFRDTTFVRNSGNFARAILGEGGTVKGSRAIGYEADPGIAQDVLIGGRSYRFAIPFIDLGVSGPRDVSDFIANTFATVKGVAINFDGALSAIRGDSTYIIDPNLRLQGLMQTTGGPNAGFDFHPQNSGSGSNQTDIGRRLAFSASMTPQIEVYDSYCYQKLGSIEVRDPIVGPIKASLRSNGQIVLVGASARGVVVIPLERQFTSGCTPR
ncbi:hypothetical protein [Roseisolibacter sp. H3M3-2]|uniref:hypothetical protein n=1 Tax=Roseisolibacter sp. H3M3-2 TaxID=3031323 RepID=UPI0023DBB90C|nr:hypothetical protein [Roseisolibacter sp. H3M3-2]MDF1503956.1 hypothetical protein [Roseisolibacter sp. H3M3-2]